MARAATTSDAFNAIAEPQRRRLLTLLRDGERPVNELARALRAGYPQPATGPVPRRPADRQVVP